MLGRLYPPLRQYWPNLPDASAPQTAFLVLDCLEALYGGAAGGGKSDALLAGALQYVDRPGYAALILRRTFKQLSLPGAIMARSKEWLAPARNAGAVHWNDDDKTWTFPSGATVTFGYLESADDIYRYQGPEFQYIAFDELTQFAEDQYRYLFSRARRRVRLDVPVRVRAASNPGGIGHAWVKTRFPIALDEEPTNKGGRIFVPAKIDDNPGLNRAEYEQSLQELDEVLRNQLMNGDWGVFEGAAFASFDRRTHVVPAFEIPEAWLRFESLDHGVANPTCSLAWAVDHDGNLVTFDSYYAPGLVSAHAAAISEKRQVWWPKDARGWLLQTPVAWADPSMFARTGATTKLGDPASVVTEYQEAGVQGIAPANNDRKAGRVRLLELLKPHQDRPFPDWHPRSGETGAPGWFIIGDRCPQLVDQLQAAPVNDKPVGEKIGPGEIVDPKWESAYGHAVAAARYGAMSWQQSFPSERPREIPADPRQAGWQDMVERELDGLEDIEGPPD